MGCPLPAKDELLQPDTEAQWPGGLLGQAKNGEGALGRVLGEAEVKDFFSSFLAGEACFPPYLSQDMTRDVKDSQEPSSLFFPHWLPYAGSALERAEGSLQ